MALWEGSAETTGKREFVHGVVAFGGGILVAAVAFALLPLGMSQLPAWLLAGVLLAGGLTFCALDAWLSRRGGSHAQMMAMMLDFVPEAIALGAVFGHDPRLGLGGILYLVFQDIAPQARMRRHWTPALGAVVGFALGMVGKQVLG